MSAPRTPQQTAQRAEVQVTVRGDVSEAMRDYAARKVREVYRYTTEPVRSAHVVLTQTADPARERSAVVEAGLEYDATSVRAQAGASEMDAAVELVADRLQRAVLRHHNRDLTRHRWLAEPEAHEWRHGATPAAHLPHFRRPVETREVVRRKAFDLTPMTIDEAAFDMEQMDYEFYLFVDTGSGRDALVHRRAEGGYAVRGDVSTTETTAGPVVLEGPAPVMDEAEAREHLDLAGEPYVFYLDRDTGRGRVLYVRYDGHYGLIRAA